MAESVEADPVSQRAEAVSTAADRVIAAWNAYLDDDTAFDELSLAVARLAAARAGRAYRPSVKRAALDGAASVSVVDLPREDSEFKGPKD